jgi:hypothetical protein
MPGLEPGIQAAPSASIPRTTALDARVEPAHDESESAVLGLGFRCHAIERVRKGAGRRCGQVHQFLSCSPRK